MQANINRFTYRLAAGILAVIAVLIAFRFCELTPVRADEEKYSWVMDDLQKDPEFDHSAYPANAMDRSLKVIQIAESADGELFVYVYRPSAESSTEYKATSINISKGINDNLYFVNYKLRLVSNCGALDKYVVENFIVSSAPLRYYEISSIYRKWIANIDEDSGSDNIVNEVAFEVGRRYTVATVNGDTYYSATDTEVIVITQHYNGTIRYTDGVSFTSLNKCDSHFVVFSTDHDIDRLLEADVEYSVQTYKKNISGTEWGEKKENVPVTLKYTDVVQSEGNGLFGQTYKWNRIQSVSEFIRNEKTLSESTIKEIENMQWVLRFVETDYIDNGGGVWSYLFGLVSGPGALVAGLAAGSEGSVVSEVTILRLMFETDGVTYNLGVVDNKQTGTTIIDGDKSFFGNNSASTIFKLVMLVLGLVAVVVVIAVTFPFLQPVYTAIANGIVWLFTAPVKAISAAAKKRKDKKSKSDKEGKK